VDGGGFRGVVDEGAGAVGAEVADLFGRCVGVFEGDVHGGGGAVGVRLGDVAGVGGAAGAYDFGVDVGVAGFCGLEGFKGEHGGSLA